MIAMLELVAVISLGLQPPNYAKDYSLYVAASLSTIGMVLVQIDEHDQERVIYYASKSLFVRFFIQDSIMILGYLTKRITCTVIKHKRKERQRIFLRETIKEKNPATSSEIESAPKR